MHGGNGLKFSMWMYLDHLQNWLVYGDGLLIFLILAPFWLSETHQILGFPGISWRTHGGNGLKFCMLLYPSDLQNCLDYGHSLVVFLILALFWPSETGLIWGFWSCSVDFLNYGAPLTETGHIWGFWALSGELVGVDVEGAVEAYFRRFASSSV